MLGCKAADTQVDPNLKSLPDRGRFWMTKEGIED